MPTIKVNIPQVGAVNFPDSMSPDEIHSTVGQIYSQALAANPPQAAGPQIAMQHSVLGDLAPRPVPRTQGAGTTQDVGGFEGSYADPDKAAFTSGAGAAAGAGLLAPAMAPAAKIVATAAAKHPVVTLFAVHLARELGVPLPKVLDVLGKFGQ